MRIGVNGARGFLGNALSKTLMLEGHEVVKFSRERGNGFTDIEDQTSLNSCDIFVHLGESAVITESNSIQNLGFDRAFEIVDFLTSSLGSRLIYASSGAVYGSHSKRPHTVHDATYAVNPYTSAKLRNESIVLANKGRVVRLSNIFGPGMTKQSVIPKLAEQVQAQQVIELRNNATRDFLFVDEAVVAISKLVGRATPNLINIGSGIGRNIDELTDTIAELLGRRGLIFKQSKSRSLLDCTILSIDDTKVFLDWRPSGNFADQIAWTIQPERRQDD